MQLTTTFRATVAVLDTESAIGQRSAIRVAAARWWQRLRWSVLLLALTIAVPIIHGYHPLAEDGGLYLAGVEFKLDAALFPRFTDFVSEHLQYSIFAPVIAGIVRLSHLPLLDAVLLIELFSITLGLLAARELLRRITRNERAQFAGMALFAALWTVPVAGTSLLLVDPYVTARSFSTPLSLWAVAFALDDWRTNTRSLIGCVLTIALAAAFHPLMAGYALGLIVVLRILRSRRKVVLLSTLAVISFSAAALLQAHAPADSAAVVLAAKSRYYWFLSQWHWYEIFGLIGPLLVMMELRNVNRDEIGAHGIALCNACLLYGCFAAAMTLAFAHESYQAHIIARLQPLRAFLMIYVIMFLLLGASLQQMLEHLAASQTLKRYARYAIVPILVGAALTMFVTERHEFPASSHIELPWRFRQSPNPWVRAFLWCRDNTPQDALFALDAHYITKAGEDAQTFRAIALRSVLPDFSKDGGEAAITPRLANEWVDGFASQLSLDQQTTRELHARLDPYGVDWVILRTSSPAVLNCPYRNEILKVCRLAPQSGKPQM